jgi:signal transduction histidine kinase
VAGCSTGEEAYSIAICLKEFLGDKQEKVQIFATDVSELAIGNAGTGTYTKREADGLTSKHLQEFFIETNGSYHVSRQVREMCVFAVHNFLKDPPFGKMDLIICRNVLIYMEPHLQKKALTAFHYALKSKGFLLGDPEINSSAADLFVPAANDDKLFSRKDNIPGRFMHMASQYNAQSLRDQNAKFKSENARTDFQKTVNDIILSKYTPVGVVVNETMDIVHFCGSTSTYLEQKPGKPSHNLLKMAKSGLAIELHSILEKVKKEKTFFIKENIQLRINDSELTIAIEGIPLPNFVEPHYLILFNNNIPIGNNEKDLRIRQLEQELAQMREDIHGVTEELQSANEQLQSASEEFQILKEELQSTHVELTAVNQELFGLNEQAIKFEEQLKQNNVTLLQKNEEVAKMSKELESFAYISSHDLQEPLRKIKTFATYILEKEHAVLSDKGKDYMHKIHDSARRMQTLMQDLLSYFSANNSERKFEKIDLNKVVEEVKNDFKEIIHKKNATIEAHDLCEASIIPFQFHQMMYNLIGNSLKFSNPEKPPHIIIKSEVAKGSKFQNKKCALTSNRLSPEKDYCHLSIYDNGIGFEPQYKDRIFEVFQRLYRKNEYLGTGIGLSIVKKIVENHNGIITATGELNKGATFDIYIPAS